MSHLLKMVSVRSNAISHFTFNYRNFLEARFILSLLKVLFRFQHSYAYLYNFVDSDNTTLLKISLMTVVLGYGNYQTSHFYILYCKVFVMHFTVIILTENTAVEYVVICSRTCFLNVMLSTFRD